MLYVLLEQKTSVTLILFCVRVPVLSEHIVVTLPSVSTAGSFLIMAFFLAIRLTPIARVIVTAADGVFEDFVVAPWGEPDLPPSRADLVGKFQALAKDRIPQDQANNIMIAVEGLRAGKIAPLLEALTPPVNF